MMRRALLAATLLIAYVINAKTGMPGINTAYGLE